MKIIWLKKIRKKKEKLFASTEYIAEILILYFTHFLAANNNTKSEIMIYMWYMKVVAQGKCQKNLFKQMHIINKN